MKVTLESFVAGLSGKRDRTIYYYHRKCGCIVSRAEASMPYQEQNRKYGLVARQLSKIQPAENYKNNLRMYLSLLSDAHLSDKMISWNNLYSKIMWNMQKKYPDTIDLTTITREIIESQNLPCRSIKSAVEDGLLPLLPGYGMFTAII